MAQGSKIIPVTFPQPLGMQMARSEAWRQSSILRQEFVTELLAILAEAKETGARARLIKAIQANLGAGLAAARKAEDLWPERDDVEKTLSETTDLKPAQAKKHRKLFEQLDRVHQRSLSLLENSFDSVHLILERVQPAGRPAQTAPSTGASSAGPARARGTSGD